VVPPALNPAQQAVLKEAVQYSPRAVGSEQASWHWKVVQRFGITLERSACQNYLHRLGFVVKRPTKRLLKADEGKRATFVDEAHCYADVDPHGMWVLKGTPALVDSTRPRYGEKASYYSAVCLETGEVEAMPLTGNSSAETSVTFLQQLRVHHTAPLVVFWDNAPAHGGDPLRAYLCSPDLRLRLVRLPAYSPDFNAAAHIWAWVRAEVTANTCFGTAARVQAAVDPFFAGLAARKDEVQRRCRTALQSRADALAAARASTTDATMCERRRR
jgi:transposase